MDLSGRAARTGDTRDRSTVRRSSGRLRRCLDRSDQLSNGRIAG
jgi:hypothetical protein